MSALDSLLETPGAEPVSPLEALRRAPRISRADVFQAADELLVHGDRPTIDRVRMRLGRGSPNTINDHLDAWWRKLGARLRDLPGQEFPQLPERVGQALQHLWTEALEGARAALQGTLAQREHVLDEREQTLATRLHQLEDLERTAATRATALEESLVLAREQLSAANQRAETLETTLHEREVEGQRLRTRIQTLEVASEELRQQVDRAETAHRAERTQLQERNAAAEARWLTEVDRAREISRQQERQIKDLRARISALQTEREDLRAEALQGRSDLKTANAVREQLEARLHAATQASAPGQRTATVRAKQLRKRKRPTP